MGLGPHARRDPALARRTAGRTFPLIRLSQDSPQSRSGYSTSVMRGSSWWRRPLVARSRCNGGQATLWYAGTADGRGADGVTVCLVRTGDPTRTRPCAPRHLCGVHRRRASAGPLAVVPAELLEGLPFGVIRLTGDGLVEAYNDTEARLARRSAASVIGRHFFNEVAPCTNVQAFAGRLALMRSAGWRRRSGSRSSSACRGRRRSCNSPSPTIPRPTGGGGRGLVARRRCNRLIADRTWWSRCRSPDGAVHGGDRPVRVQPVHTRIEIRVDVHLQPVIHPHLETGSCRRHLEVDLAAAVRVPVREPRGAGGQCRLRAGQQQIRSRRPCSRRLASRAATGSVAPEAAGAGIRPAQHELPAARVVAHAAGHRRRRIRLRAAARARTTAHARGTRIPAKPAARRDRPCHLPTSVSWHVDRPGRQLVMAQSPPPGRSGRRCRGDARGDATRRCVHRRAPKSSAQSAHHGATPPANGSMTSTAWPSRAAPSSAPRTASRASGGSSFTV